jgi:hypothetical protein
LIFKGYLVHSHGNTYDFFEVPQPRAVVKKNDTSLVNDFSNVCPTAVNEVTDAVNLCTASNREINNSENSINNEITNIENPSRIEAPKVKEIIIKAPKAEGKIRPPVQDKKPCAFEF